MSGTKNSCLTDSTSTEHNLNSKHFNNLIRNLANIARRLAAVFICGNRRAHGKE